MTIQEFQSQLLEINRQFTNIKTEVTKMQISGNEEMQVVQYQKDVQPNLEILHASLITSLQMLTEEQRKEIANLVVYAGKLKTEIFQSCSSQYRTNYVKMREERKNAKMENLEDLRSNPL